MSLKIAINGLGRMGRNIFRWAIKRNIEVVAINDIAPLNTLIYLLEYDSAHGVFDIKYSFDKDFLSLSYLDKTYSIRVNNTSNPKDMDLNKADILLECSGKNLSSNSVLPYLENGVKKVIISANTIDDTKTFVLGVNEKDYRGEKIISNASCTTNCIGPLCDILDRHFNIEAGMLTTIHSYTNNQSLLDNAHKNSLRRSRSAPNNIIPTSTGAALGLKKILPRLENKIHGQSLRVPVLDVSMSDLNIYLTRPFSIEEVKEIFINESNSRLKNILEIDSKFRVSTDFLGSQKSAIIPFDLILKVGSMIKIMAWYDNETGYANRMLDMASFIYTSS